MADLDLIEPIPQLEPIPLISVNDLVEGGPEGAANKQAIALANNFAFSKMFSGLKWEYYKGGYKLDSRVMLDNGDIVKSIIPDNMADPNIDMAGWQIEGIEKQEFGRQKKGTLSRFGTIYELQGTVEKQESRTIFHDFRPLIIDGSVFNTDGGNLFWGLGAGNTTMKAVPSGELPLTGFDPNLQCSHNVGYGANALHSLTIGYKNVAVGNNALRYLTRGHNNVSLGQESMRGSIDSIGSIAIGGGAGYYINGNYNISIGYTSLYNNLQGQTNIALGHRAGLSATDGSSNIFLGTESGSGQLTGDNNTLIGRQDVNNGITSGSNNVVVGSRVTGLENASGQLVLANGAGVKYVVCSASGSSQGFADIVGREPTAVDLTAPSQTDAGTTIKVRNTSNGSGFAQLIFQSRVNQPYSRIVQWGGATPKLSLVNNSIEAIRINESGGVSQKVNAATTLLSNGTMTFELTSNTQLKIKVRGNDGVTRSAVLNLA